MKQITESFKNELPHPAKLEEKMGGNPKALVQYKVSPRAILKKHAEFPAAT